MPLHDEDIAVIGNDDVVGLIQLARTGGLVPLAGLAPRSDRQQRLAVAVHLDDDVRSDIGRPQVAVAVDAQAVRAGEELVAERANEGAVAIEFEERLVATGQDEQMPVGIEVHARRGAHRHSGGKGDRRRGHDIVQLGHALRHEQRRI